MKKMLWFAILVFIGMAFVVMPGSACIGAIDPPINQGEGIVWEMSGADFDTGTLNPPLSHYNQWDIWWEQISSTEYQMTPVNGATIVNLGVVNFDKITDEQIVRLLTRTTPIPGNQLVDGDVFAVHAHGINVKVRVLNYGDNIHLEWVTYGPPVTACIPEFPSGILPAILIIGFLGAVLLIQRTRER
jgi:hypothetical protein